jgi:peroxiredoxin
MSLLRDKRDEFERAGVEAVGLSRDSPWTLIAWAQALDLDFPLLSDWNGEAVRGLGVARDYRGFGDVADRAAFLIDRGGVVVGAWRYEDAEIPDFDALIAAARSLPLSP